MLLLCFLLDFFRRRGVEAGRGGKNESKGTLSSFPLFSLPSSSDELGPSSRSASPTRDSFASPSQPKGSYTKVEIVDDQSLAHSPSSISSRSLQQPTPPLIRIGPEQYLKLGIQHHSNQRSSDDLSLAAMYFREAATIDGGCPGGMLFWGLTLRSGWGVVKDERKGFEWLRRACEPRPLGTGGEGGGGGRRGSDGGMGGGGETESAALAPEMVVAILEVAQCFLHGWGCAKVSHLFEGGWPRETRPVRGFERADFFLFRRVVRTASDLFEQDPEKAVNYLLVAAKMGDVDAQLREFSPLSLSVEDLVFLWFIPKLLRLRN